MTLRRVWIHLMACDNAERLFELLDADAQRATSKPTPDKLRSRQREWQERNDRAKEASGE